MRSYVMKSCGALLGLGLTLMVAGCGGTTVAGSTYVDEHPIPQDAMVTEATEVGAYGGRFIIGQTNAPKTFNAIMANETSSSDLTQRLFTSLADYDNKAQLTGPMLAKSWDVSDDGTEWRFHLRRGAAFSDGHPITSEDVLFAFEVAYDEELHPSIQDLLMIEGEAFEVSAPDSYTVDIKIPSPYAMMIPAIGSLRIMPKHILGESYEQGDFASMYDVSTDPAEVVTSGAWSVKQYVPNEKTVLTRNPHWFGVDREGNRLPYLDELVFLIVPDQEAAALKFKAGELDGLDNVKPEDYKDFAAGQEKGNYTLYDLGPSLSTNFFWFNLNKVRKPKEGKKLGDPQTDPLKYSWFNNKMFRRACSMAIDRESIIKSVWFGEAVKNWSQSTPGNKIWYTPEVTAYDYDPEGAKALLASIGWKDTDGDGYVEDTKGNTINFTIKTNSDNVLRVKMANFIRDDLEKIGVKCVLTPVDFNTLIVNLREDFGYEAILLGLQSGVPPDPGMGQNVWKSSGLTHFWNVKQPKPETRAEARVDRLIAQNVATIDMDVRKKTWTEIQQIMNDESFFIWLPVLKTKIPVSNKFGNLEPTIIPHRIIWNIERIFVKSRKRA